LNGLYASLTNIIVDYFGFHGRSAYFNGNSASIEIPALSNRQFNAFGLSLWFRRVGTGRGIQGLVHNGDCRQFGSIHVYSYDQNDVSVEVTTIYENITIGAKPASYNDWHHVVLSYDGAFIQLFIDNVLVSTVAASGPTVLASCPLLFGHNYVSDVIGLTGGWFNGYMDNICFYNHAFSVSQVNDLFNFIMA